MIALLVTIFAPTVNYLFLYCLAIFSVIDHILYLSFMPFAAIFVMLAASLYMYSSFGGIELASYIDETKLKDIEFTQSTYEQVEKDKLQEEAIVMQNSAIVKFGSLGLGIGQEELGELQANNIAGKIAVTDAVDLDQEIDIAAGIKAALEGTNTISSPPVRAPFNKKLFQEK